MKGGLDMHTITQFNKTNEYIKLLINPHMYTLLHRLFGKDSKVKINNHHSYSFDDYNDSPNCTFKPKINNNYNVIRTNSNDDAFNRLFKV